MDEITSWSVRWAVTTTGSTVDEYKSEAAARRRVKQLQAEWGDQITLLELDCYDGPTCLVDKTVDFLD